MSDQLTTPPDSTAAGLQTGPVGADRAMADATLLGTVMSLVAIALGAATAGVVLGRGLAPGTALVLSFVAIGMLLTQSFGGARFRAGHFAVGWLIAVAFLLGLGLGPVISYYASVDSGIIVQAAGVTALVVAAMAAAGLAIGRDLTGWLRGLSLVTLGILVAALVLLLIGGGGSPLLSIAIAVVSALYLLVDFNYLRRHGTQDDAVLLATSIFVSVVNLFVSLVDLFARDR